MQEGEPIYHPWLNKSIEKAQKRVEERNFEIRKHLLEYDDVLNQQRKFIYDQRDRILTDRNLGGRVNDATGEMIRMTMDTYRDHRRDAAEALQELTDFLKTQFGYTLLLDPQDKESLTPEKLEGRILEDLEQDIREKENLVGVDNFNAFIRMQYLQSIDRKWLDHLENMEGLREAVYLRSYAQKNPLTEYKLEGSQIFDTMIDTIRREIASRVHLVRIQAAGDRETKNRSMATVQSASHGSMGAFSSSAPGGGNAGGKGAGGAGAQPQSVTVVRTYPKVGRNDPCPCGSGKKYKFCHGR
jgi:preprotein translocase subunit SecA